MVFRFKPTAPRSRSAAPSLSPRSRAMSFTMYDSITAFDIPREAPAVAGYLNGGTAWTGTDWARFPTALKVGIVVSPVNLGDVLDCEAGDATPAQCPAWIR